VQDSVTVSDFGIDEDAETLFPRHLLQRQGNQITEPAIARD
jgi:hypothetical protein